ncbi:MAG TPA: undecaprenyl-diphosphate phosphatase [Ktedonobacteraceae bacterium]|nr:undecaprenyl-diphosphate phosphatase [Ktedonobacteraceae bacterium]
MILNIWEVIILSLLQGVTELFPISSLGHTVIVPGLLPGIFGQGGANLVNDPNFLPLIVALHLGTSIALFIYFWRDWFQVIRSLFTAIKVGEVKRGTEEWVSFLIIIGCIPAGLIGAFLDKPLKTLFASPYIAAAFLLANGSLLFLGEQMLNFWSVRRENMDAKQREAQFRPLSSLNWKEAIVVGVAQSMALIPGISRSGASMVAGLGIRLNHEEAARYSFLLGAPLIGAAALLEVPSLFHLPTASLLYVLLGVVLSGVAAFVTTKFLMRYFQTGRLYPFAWYCWGAGAVALVLLVVVLHYPL